MGNVLTFTPRPPVRGSHPVQSARLGVVVLFTGIRYQRTDSAPKKSATGRKRKV